MTKLFWKIKYARHLKKRIGLSFFQCMNNAKAALESADYDLTECPIEWADEEYYAWASDCVE